MRAATIVTTAFLLALAAPGAPASAQTGSDLFPMVQTLSASDGAASDLFGSAISQSGETIAIGVPYDVVGANPNQGSVRIMVRTNGAWTAQATITASDGAAGDLFGSSVALSGDTLAVGVPQDWVGGLQWQGSVRIFVRSGTTWTQQATITASDGVAFDFFGAAVALSGNTLAVGMPYDGVGANAAQGSVRVFVRSGTTWTAQATLTAADGVAQEQFGAAVAISGETIAVGVPFDGVGANASQGSVRVFVRNATTWSAQAAITAADGAGNDRLGTSVALSGDLLVAGAPYDTVGSNVGQGSARVFARSGTAWTAQATLTAADGAASDYLGLGVAIHGDLVAVAAPYDAVGANINQGTVRMFSHVGSGWSPLATVTPSDAVAGDRFGLGGVALFVGGLAVGAPYDRVGNNADQGSVRTFNSYRIYCGGGGFDDLSLAVNASGSGSSLVVSAAGFSMADGIIDGSSKSLTYYALQPLTLSPTALLTAGPGTVFDMAQGVTSAGLTIAGKLVGPDAGTLTFEQLAVASGGQFMQRGCTVLVNQGLSTASGGVCYLQGQVLAEGVSTAVGGQNRVAGDTDVFANYANAGSTVIQRGILYIYGTLTNTGTMTGQYNNGFVPPNPGDGYSVGGDYAVSAASSLVLAEPVWWLRVGGDFDMAINDPSRFVMDAATLELTGLGTNAGQAVEAFGADLGPVQGGFANSNFLLGAMRVRAGATVRLVDAHDNAPGSAAEAIYTKELHVPAGATLVTNGHRVYARSVAIGGTVSNPADVIVVPGAPPCPADLYPDGVVNGADLGILLAQWGPCAATCTADLDASGVVNGADLGLLLAAWGACAQ